MTGLDVHMLMQEGLGKRERRWARQAVASVCAAALAAGFPVAVHAVPAVEGHVGLARQAGFAEGAHPFVTFVDCDDWIDRDAFACLRSHLVPGARLVRTMGWNVPVVGRATRTSAGLVVVARADAAAFAWDEHPLCGTCALQASLPLAAQEPAAVYHRRIYDSPARRLRAATGAASCLG